MKFQLNNMKKKHKYTWKKWNKMVRIGIIPDGQIRKDDQGRYSSLRYY